MAITGSTLMEGGGKDLVSETYHFTAAAGDNSFNIPTDLSRVVKMDATIFGTISEDVCWNLGGTAGTAAGEKFGYIVGTNGYVPFKWRGTVEAKSFAVTSWGYN